MPARTPRKATLNHDALAALGAEKLARLVLDEAGRNAPFKRLVSAALAGALGPEAVAAVIDRRLAGLERAKGIIDWDKRKAFVADLDGTVSAVVGELGGVDPVAAVERLLRLLATVGPVLERVDDSSGQVQGVYERAAEALPALLERLSETERANIAVALVTPLLRDEYGLLEGVIGEVLARLTACGLDRFEAALDGAGSAAAPAGEGWAVRLHADRLLRLRKAVADRRGDVDAFIALEARRPEHLRDPLGVARRLLAAGRAAEALEWVRRPRRAGVHVLDAIDLADDTGIRDPSDEEQVRLEVAALEALGETQAAQALRWRTFETTLDGEVLRDHLAALPDFEDFAALDRAFAHAGAHAHRHAALAFFLGWPRLDLAAKLVLEHRDAWQGRHYDVLGPAADTLTADHPEAATVLYRVLIDDILARARSSAYGHAARYLARLDDVAPLAAPGALTPDHEAYRAGLKRAHGRKAAFWGLVRG